MDSSDTSLKTGRTGIAGICERLHELERQPGMTTCPALVCLDKAMEDAVRQTRSRLSEMGEWARHGPADRDVMALSHFEHLVRDLAIDTIFLLRPRSPSWNPRQPMTIGRSRRCDVCIPDDDSVSAVHASVTTRRGDYVQDDSEYHVPGDCYILDMDSRHGVRINGEPVPAGEMRQLLRNDIVTLGRATLLFIDAHMQRLLVRSA